MDQTAEITTQPESRVKKTLLNAKINLIFYVLTLILTFFSRGLFLETLGVEFIGFTGTLTNLLSFLNIAELGVGLAIGYVLYKPLQEANQEKICEVISVLGYLYRWIGFAILIGGLILALFLPIIYPVETTGYSYYLIYFAYFSFLGSSLIGYFLNYRQTLLSADQRNYVVSGYFQGGNIVKVIVQMALAYYTQSYYLWVVVEFVCSLIFAWILNVKIHQTYPWLKTNIKEGKALLKNYPEIKRYVRQLFFSRISIFAQYQTMPMLIYGFVNLSIVAFYQNYMVVVDKGSALISMFITGSNAGVGNLIAEGNKTKILRVYWELFTVEIFMASIIGFFLTILLNPFISIWLGSQYLLSNIVIALIIARFFMGQTKNITEQFIMGYGMFHDIWAAFAELGIYLGAAIIGGYLYGLPGVLSGGVLSFLLIQWLWKPIFLFTQGLKVSALIYWSNLVGYYMIIAVCASFSYVVMSKISIVNPFSSFFDLIVYAVLSGILYIIPLFALFYIFKPGMKLLVNRVKDKLGR